MVDIHCHILCGVDDGAEDFETSMHMATQAVESGTTAIIASPHANIPDAPFQFSCQSILHDIRDFNLALAKEGIPLTVYPGCEIFGAGDFVKLLKEGKLLTLNNSRYPLVEFDFYEHPASVFMKLEELCSEGFVPIVAHPERYAFVEEDESSIGALKDMGCLIQCNKGSLLGRFGASAKFVAHQMLVREQVDFIASDAHGFDMRTPILEDAYRMVYDLYGEAYAKLLFETNPQKLLKDEAI